MHVNPWSFRQPGRSPRPARSTTAVRQRGARSSTSSPTPGVRRLREVKRAYDPDGFFRVGHVVEP
ncbi:BBE domain-containing protein [Nonomuraea wenchangensis]|uniref:BBE domain-containing protein n=1 Tax=Nonomuraea wenchangensis TaxID=568860 RepID=UPI0033E557FB